MSDAGLGGCRHCGRMTSRYGLADTWDPKSEELQGFVLFDCGCQDVARTAIGKAIQAARIEREISLRDIAAVLEVDIPTYSGWEFGRGMPSNWQIMLIAQHFGLLSELDTWQRLAGHRGAGA